MQLFDTPPGGPTEIHLCMVLFLTTHSLLPHSLPGAPYFLNSYIPKVLLAPELLEVGWEEASVWCTPCVQKVGKGGVADALPLLSGPGALGWSGMGVPGRSPWVWWLPRLHRP
jgi:hypothetical protein